MEAIWFGECYIFGRVVKILVGIGVFIMLWMPIDSFLEMSVCFYNDFYTPITNLIPITFDVPLCFICFYFLFL